MFLNTCFHSFIYLFHFQEKLTDRAPAPPPWQTTQLAPVLVAAAPSLAFASDDLSRPILALVAATLSALGLTSLASLPNEFENATRRSLAQVTPPPPSLQFKMNLWVGNILEHDNAFLYFF
jgi:hypothetical protein